MLFVQSSYEVGHIARQRAAFEELGARVLVAAPDAIDLCNDKAAMHAALSGLPVPQPRLLLPAGLEAFVAGAHDLGYPDVPVCFKPPVSKGSRGFRILSAAVDEVDLLLHGRPNNLYMTLDEFVALFTGVEPFPPLMLMECVAGTEFTVDALVDGGEIVLAQTKTREAIDTGLAMSFRTVDRPDLVAVSRHVCRRLSLEWFVNIQFKGDYLLEVNPRVSTFVYQDDFILPYLGVKYALGELNGEAVRDRPGAGASVATHRALLRPGLLGRLRARSHRPPDSCRPGPRLAATLHAEARGTPEADGMMRCREHPRGLTPVSHAGPSRFALRPRSGPRAA